MLNFDNTCVESSRQASYRRGLEKLAFTDGLEDTNAQSDDEYSLDEMHTMLCNNVIPNMLQRVNESMVREAVANLTQLGFWEDEALATVNPEKAAEVLRGLLAYLEDNPPEHFIEEVYDSLGRFMDWSKVQSVKKTAAIEKRSYDIGPNHWAVDQTAEGGLQLIRAHDDSQGTFEDPSNEPMFTSY